MGTTEIADATTNELAVRSGHVEGVSVSTGLVAGHAYPVPCLIFWTYGSRRNPSRKLSLKLIIPYCSNDLFIWSFPCRKEVLRCCTVQGRRLLFLKNPWGHTRWKGKFSPGDVQWQANPGLAEALNYDNRAAAARDTRL